MNITVSETELVVRDAASVNSGKWLFVRNCVAAERIMYSIKNGAC